MTSRARSKAFDPVLAVVYKWTDGAVIFRSVETSRTFMVPQSICLIQPVEGSVIELTARKANAFDDSERSALLEQVCCIAWVPRWKLEELHDKGEGVPVMTPPTPEKVTS